MKSDVCTLLALDDGYWRANVKDLNKMMDKYFLELFKFNIKIQNMMMMRCWFIRQVLIFCYDSFNIH